ncbi:hypothetical protein QBC45DRAFT_340856, partial [Copromyces sp. CBS 386.78]
YLYAKATNYILKGTYLIITILLQFIRIDIILYNTLKYIRARYAVYFICNVSRYY